MALIFGLGTVLERPAFLGVVGLAGGVALLVTGALMLRVTRSLKLPQESQGQRGGAPLSAAGIVATGALTSLTNPYFTLWWATVGLNLLGQARPLGALGYAVFYVGHVSADLIWYGAVSESVHRGRKLLSDRGYRWLVGACGTVLMAFGLFFAWRGWHFVRMA